MSPDEMEREIHMLGARVAMLERCLWAVLDGNTAARVYLAPPRNAKAQRATTDGTDEGGSE